MAQPAAEEACGCAAAPGDDGEEMNGRKVALITGITGQSWESRTLAGLCASLGEPICTPLPFRIMQIVLAFEHKLSSRCLQYAVDKLDTPEVMVKGETASCLSKMFLKLDYENGHIESTSE
ncbi:hypothetical protein DUI87_08283 [Hirundo rustica rustica]|uniref:Uncharacterized protein n=1 Tax=Hirundo rustica rustica TaxID=333673 RepID=A0A3M0KXA9_HIRRU|nr:hypothetical protein DUI87_08283 [Hirundo rustica rustica]